MMIDFKTVQAHLGGCELRLQGACFLLKSNAHICNALKAEKDKNKICKIW